MKFDYRLEQWDKTVLFQVLEMDESLRSKKDNIKLFEHEGIAIYSHEDVGICYETDDYYPEIYLRGWLGTSDTNVASFKFNTIEEATEYFNKVKSTLEVFKQSLEIAVLTQKQLGEVCEELRIPFKFEFVKEDE